MCPPDEALEEALPEDAAPEARTAPPGAPGRGHDEGPDERTEPAPEPEAASDPLASAFPVVGIGASAGWFEAVSEMLRAVPHGSGMAYVLVTHLDPRHESRLDEVVARMTSMPVRQAEEGMLVRPDHVYVVPPSCLLTLGDGRLHVEPRPPGPGHHNLIDRFFRSLAEDQGVQSLAVVLSGTLSDGTSGLHDVRAAGGLTFAQRPDTAAHPDMPLNAIRGGHVDFVLPPADIAAELLRLRPHVAQQGVTLADWTRMSREASANIDDLFRILRLRTGADFSQYRRSTLMRRIHRRMMAHRQETLAGYVELLRSDPKEPGMLFDEILIHVTSFFRDREAWEQLRDRVLPILVADRKRDQPLRVWVAGCSTGEEAYTVAILLLDFLRERGLDLEVQVFGSDISERAIATARDGRYPETIADDLPPDMLLRHFQRVENGYQVSKSLRGVCVFAVHNVLSDPPFSNMDLATCRNLLVYLEPELQRRLLATLHYALKPTGALLLGSSESVGRSEGLFEPVDKEHRLYRKRLLSAPPPHLLPPLAPRARAEGRAQEDGEPGWSDGDLQREVDREVLDRYGPAGVVVNRDLDVLQFRGHVTPYLEVQPGAPSVNLLRLAPSVLGSAVRRAVEEADRDGQTVRAVDVRVEREGGVRTVALEVTPLRGPAGGAPGLFLVLFLEGEAQERRRGGRAGAGGAARRGRGMPAISLFGRRAQAEQRRRIAALEQEMEGLESYLQQLMEDHDAVTEELRSANEEALSTNEELQSTNEELETAKEELQSTNEELSTLNEELQQRNIEIHRVNDDLMNLFHSVGLPIVMVGPDLRVRRFTPKAQEFFHLIPTDVGRPFTDIRLPFEGADLQREMLEVMDTFRLREREVLDTEARHHLLQIHPYRTADNRVDGVVVAVLPPDLAKRRSSGVEAALEAAHILAETVQDAVAVLDSRFRVKAANLAFHRRFGSDPVEALGRPIAEVGGPWATSEARDLLERLLPEEGSVTGHRIPAGPDAPAEDEGRSGEVLVNARRHRFYAGEDLLVLAARPADGSPGRDAAQEG